MVQQTATTTHPAIPILQKIFECEMAGIVRYLHYSFMIMGYNRIPIQKWFRDQANEGVKHTIVIGEKITSLGGHPAAVTAAVNETNLHTIEGMLRESLEFEAEALGHYRNLVTIAETEGDIALEELARELVRAEQEHLDEVNKMLRSPR
ncbi:MAG: ferritin-like domain-containing protein [Vulcanimicrobiaceae bacterium]